MQFTSVIGQHSVKKSLRTAASGNRIPHALIFLGPQGSGKLALAMAFAQFLLCENQTEEDSCGKCAGCIKASKLIHPDLHFSFPTIGTNVKSDQFYPEWRKAMDENPYLNVNDWLQSIGAENKQGNINKEECLNIIRKLSLKTFEGSKKVLIMWLPEFLGKEGNRLLKLIEEPPENTHFILVAENSDLILNTILSRCQIVKINQLTDEEIVEALVSKKGISKERAQSVSHLSDGNFNEALKLVTQAENDNANMFLDWMRKCYIGKGPELVAWTEVFAKIGRENQKQFLRYGLHFMREYMTLKVMSDTGVGGGSPSEPVPNTREVRGAPGVRLAQKELTTAQNLMKVIEFHQIEQIVQLFTDCSYYIERNANPKILFLDAGIQLNRILKTKKAVGSSTVGS